MYFVGIDISKFKHACAILDELGAVITSSGSFNNDCEGFSLFVDHLNTLDGDKKIGFESAGHYGHREPQLRQHRPVIRYSKLAYITNS